MNTTPTLTSATLVQVREALQLLGWPPTRRESLLRAARLGRVPCVRIGKNVWFSPVALAAFATGNLTEATR